MHVCVSTYVCFCFCVFLCICVFVRESDPAYHPLYSNDRNALPIYGIFPQSGKRALTAYKYLKCVYM